MGGDQEGLLELWSHHHQLHQEEGRCCEVQSRFVPRLKKPMLVCWLPVSSNGPLQRVVAILTSPLCFLDRSLLGQILLAAIFPHSLQHFSGRKGPGKAALLPNPRLLLNPQIGGRIPASQSSAHEAALAEPTALNAHSQLMRWVRNISVPSRVALPLQNPHRTKMHREDVLVF